MLNIISLGLLRVFMALILTGIEGFFGMNWLVCLVSRTCLSALGVIFRHPFPYFYQAMVEFPDFFFDQGLMDLPFVG